MLDRRHFLAGAGASLAVAASGPASAQAWPSKPVRFIVPFVAGGGSDVAARLLAEELRRVLGVPFVIENRPGLAGSLGADAAAKAEPDGYTIVIATPGVQMTNPFLYARLPYDAMKDLRPIVHVAQLPSVLVVHPSVPAKTTAEFIAHAKANPGKLNFASNGPGSASHLAVELFKTMAGIDMIHVPYRGSGPALLDLVGGRVDCAIDSLTAMMPQVRDGKLRALGVSTAQRVSLEPNLPPIADGLPGYDAFTLLYLTTGSAVPDAAVTKLNAAVNEILALPEIKRRFEEQGMLPTGGTPAELQAVIETERVKWKRIIDVAGVKVE
ncbi:tripartite tricarboxylate transporter substrate binding protein [Bosea sp. BK604]|uniref:Bug family tripartite tricarboxylate transporter substrate binding protein n=1 Tax=Bosea sp. BK604 TaxID=2512180 RepID=UPI0010DE48E3|nr:tripartite tricarboxylate transporter substrate binding protein [Bosea sp. BK604]TCR66177.1 tripartite-type tricarboxylate transporter receptor subunit TctC [Bosea sp. BK604]